MTAKNPENGKGPQEGHGPNHPGDADAAYGRRAQGGADGERHFHYHEHRHHHADTNRHRHGRATGQPGLITRVTAGIAETFDIPRKGVVIALVLLLVFNFPVAVAIFALGWAWVDRPEWFASLAEKWRSIRHPGARRPSASYAGATASTSSASSASATSSGASSGRAAPGSRAEDDWMGDLRRQFDRLEKRTGAMEGYVASADYRVSSEIARMHREDGENPAPPTESNGTARP